MIRYNSYYLSIAVLLLVAVALFSFHSLSVILAEDELTPTPVPLLHPPENMEQLQALVLGADNCPLPCFWGFRPGHTSVDDVIAFAQPEGDFSDLRGEYSISYDFVHDDEEIPPLNITFFVEDNLLTGLHLIVRHPAEWMPPETLELSHLLATMASTPEIYLAVNTGQGRIFLTLVYDEEGVLAQYPFPLRVRGNVMSPNIDKPILLCPDPQLNDFWIFWLQAGDGRELLEEHYYGFTPDATSNPNWTVEQMTGLDIVEFTEQIISNPEECIEMLSYPELLEQGYDY